MTRAPLSPLDRRRLAFIAYSDAARQPTGPVATAVWTAYGIFPTHGEGDDSPREPDRRLRVDVALRPLPGITPGALVVALRARLVALFPDSVTSAHLAFAERGLASLNLPELVYGLLPLSSHWRLLLDSHRRTDLLLDTDWRNMLGRVELQGSVRGR